MKKYQTTEAKIYNRVANNISFHYQSTQRGISDNIEVSKNNSEYNTAQDTTISYTAK
jgi:hypothetical protein